MRCAFHFAAMTACFLTALPAAAGCVTADTLATGVAFTRADGMGGLAVRDGANVRIEYRYSAPKGNRDDRTGRFGIYETKTISEGTRRNGTTLERRARHETATRLSPAGKEPMPGQTLKMRWREITEACIGSECEEIWRSWGAVTYRFLTSQTVRISGCAYEVIPVEATFFGTVPLSTTRWLYFPELGFGLETRVTDHVHETEQKLGLTSMTAAR